MPRNRWVIYTEKKWLEYDGSQIPPEWHRWMHHICVFFYLNFILNKFLG
jgi:NADH:ubiquinone oxidoreductase subunit